MIVEEQTPEENKEDVKEEEIQEPSLEDKPKEPKKEFKLSDLTKIEMQIGWNAGILLGFLGIGISLVFLTQQSWWMKIVYILLSVGMVGQQIMNLSMLIKMRKQYIMGQEQLRKMMETFPEIHREANYIQ